MSHPFEVLYLIIVCSDVLPEKEPVFKEHIGLLRLTMLSICNSVLARRVLTILNFLCQSNLVGSCLRYEPVYFHRRWSSQRDHCQLLDSLLQAYHGACSLDSGRCGE